MKRALAASVFLVACSRSGTPSPAPAEPAPSAKVEAPAPVASASAAPAASAVEEPKPAAKAAKAEDAGAKPSGLMLAAAVPSEGDAEAPPPERGSLAGKVVLHVGDSMVGGSWGLTRYLEAKFTREGAKFFHETKVSESITSFDKGERMKDLVARYHPDIILLTLGTNDALVPFPQSLSHHVQSIAKPVGDRSCWWIGPPLWKPDTGILGVIRDNAAPCRFYDSSKLDLERGSDGIHPTDRGGAAWADAFWKAFRGGE